MRSRNMLKRLRSKPRVKVICKGTIPGTSQPCRSEICETDGEQYFLKSDIVLKIDPPRITCDNCGRVVRLQNREKLSLRKLDIGSKNA